MTNALWQIREEFVWIISKQPVLVDKNT